MKLLQLLLVFLTLCLSANAQSFFVTDVLDQSQKKKLKSDDKKIINQLLVEELEKRKSDFCIQLINGEDRTKLASSSGFMMMNWELAHKGGIPKQLGVDVYVKVIYEDGLLKSENVIVKNAARYTNEDVTSKSKDLKGQISALVEGMVSTFNDKICQQIGDDFAQFSPEMNQHIIELIHSNEKPAHTVLREVEMQIKEVLQKNYAQKGGASYQACEYMGQSSPSKGVSCILANKRTFYGTMENEAVMKRIKNLIWMNIYWSYYNVYVQNYDEAKASLDRVEYEIRKSDDLKADFYAIYLIADTFKNNEVNAILLDKTKEKVSNEVLYQKVNFYLNEIQNTSNSTDLTGVATNMQRQFSSL
ncbi:hypothetical protein [Flammeovirga aprica]|uniref:Uncharacterized protein n=1 Tax=Flammeovirga aprica JL-4 TaxID=694437 RepID=A0A7X9RVZ0_9BACT|nr:hypothetical protein [Flammeovirga aprica]NME69706.1 hypothetical protein [Flammeovirga aprica JL-4]